MFAALCQAGQPNRARKGQGTQNVGGTLGLIVLLLDDKDTRSALSFIVKAKQIAVCPKARCCEQNGKAPKAPPVVLHICMIALLYIHTYIHTYMYP